MFFIFNRIASFFSFIGRAVADFFRESFHNMKDDLKRKPVSDRIFAITLTAVFVAASIVLCRYVGISPQNSAFRFDLGFLPIAFVGLWLGPAYSGVAYLLSDVLGQLLFSFPDPWIAGCKFIFGFALGLFFYKRKISLPRTLVAFLFINVIVDLILMAMGFCFFFGFTAREAFFIRFINVLITYPIRVFTFFLAAKAVERPMRRVAKGRLPWLSDEKKEKSFHSYANSFQAVTVPGLERIGALCKRLGSPEKTLRVIHIAGTNGKGSVAAYTASILDAAGLRVGKYISPNLIRVNERVSINGTEITDEEMESILSRIEPLCAEVEKECGIPPTQFEIWTAMAFLYFAEKQCDYVVLEVGLGGEFDATNLVPQNEIAVITRLGLDHTQYLGSTLAEVAAAKCGILKKSSATRTLVTVEQDAEAMRVIREKAAEKEINVVVAAPTLLGNEGIHERFTMEGFPELLCGLGGMHQPENAAIAATLARILGIGDDAITRGIRDAKNPARFELISHTPPVIFDGGHNPNGIAALVSSLRRYYGDAPKTVIFACMADKEIAPSLSGLAAGETEFIYTTVKDNPRAMSAEDLAARAKSEGFDGLAISTIKDAYGTALSRGRLTVICGSLYLYKDLAEEVLLPKNL